MDVELFHRAAQLASGYRAAPVRQIAGSQQFPDSHHRLHAENYDPTANPPPPGRRSPTARSCSDCSNCAIGMKRRRRQPKERRPRSKRENSFVAVVVERAVIPVSISTKRTPVDVYFPSLLFRSCLDRRGGPCLQSGRRSRIVCEPSRGSNRRGSTSIG
jgi:hypothetical protein